MAEVIEIELIVRRTRQLHCPRPEPALSKDTNVRALLITAGDIDIRATAVQRT